MYFADRYKNDFTKKSDLDDTTPSGGLVDVTRERPEDSAEDLEGDEEAADELEEDSESEKTKLARRSAKLSVTLWSRPIFSRPFCITLSTTSSAGSSSSDLAKIWRNKRATRPELCPSDSAKRRGYSLAQSRNEDTSPAPRITPTRCMEEMEEPV